MSRGRPDQPLPKPRPFRLIVAGPILLATVAAAPCSPAASAEPPVTAAVFAPDGASVVTASQAGIEVRTWPELELERAIGTRLSHVHDLCFSPDGQKLAAAGGRPAEEGAVEWFSWPRCEAIELVTGHEDLVYAVSCAADGAHWATAGADRLALVWQDGREKPLVQLDGHAQAVLAAAFLPDGQILITAGIDGSLLAWNAGDGRQLRAMTNHTAPVLGLAVRPATAAGAEPWVASVSSDRTVRLWQPAIGRMVRFARLASPPRSVAWTFDGRQIVVGCEDGHVRVVDPRTVQVVDDLPAIDGWVHSLAASPITREVLAAGDDAAIRRISLKSEATRP